VYKKWLFTFLICCFILLTEYKSIVYSQESYSPISSLAGSYFNTSTYSINPLVNLKFNKNKIVNPKSEKISSNLLKLIDNNFLLPNEDRIKLISQMKEMKQFIGKEDSVNDIDRRIENKAHNDLVYVYIRLKKDTNTTIIDNYVWKVTDRDEKNHLVAALIEPNKLEALALLSEVDSIQSVLAPVTNSGSVVTEGDLIHRTNSVRSTYLQSGSGIKIGVISDGVDNIASARSSGDLPAEVTILENAIGGDEGTAMLEIIYDMVPNASLYFHDCGSNTIAFNSAVDDLVAAGVNIIVDDIIWLNEPYFEDGTIASHIASLITTNNIVYISSAGNNGQKHYQGDYYNDGYNFHDFSRNPTTNSYLYVNIPNNSTVQIILQWNDNYGTSNNDYDLVLFNTSNYNILSDSRNIQNGNDIPYENIIYTNTTGNTIDGEINIYNYQGLAASKTLEIFIYTYSGSAIYSNNITPIDSIFGHQAVTEVIAVGAISATDPGNDTIELYSSQGPVTINNQSQRQKPDISGIDCVSITGAGGFPTPFCGTSAAAPHIAAIVAQLWGQYPLSTSSQIKNHILNTAIDLGTAGLDNIFGYGRADALLSYQAGPAIPIFSLPGGNYNGSIYISLSSENSTSIRYTLDNSEPTCSSAVYSSPLLITSTKNLKAVACNDLGISEIKSETYTINTPVSTWYLAEGYTGESFVTLGLIQNPTDIAANVTVTFMVQGGDNITKSYTVPANSRYTVNYNRDIGAGKSVSAKFASDQDIIVERAVYWDAGGVHYAGGHNTMGKL